MRDDDERRPGPAPLLGDLRRRDARVQPREVLVADLDHVGQPDERVDHGQRVRGGAHEHGPQVGVVGDGRRRAAAGHDRRDRGTAGLQHGRDRAGVDDERAAGLLVPRLGQVPLEVELVGRGPLGVEVRRRDGGAQRRPVALQDVDARAAQVPAHQVAVRVLTEPRQQVHAPAEPAEPEGDVGGAAPGVLRATAVRARDHVDERLADDEGPVCCRRGHRVSSSSVLAFVRSCRARPAVPHGTEPLACTVQPLLAPRRQRLTALPERERLLERRRTGLEPRDDRDELVAGLLVAEGGHVGVRVGRRAAEPTTRRGGLGRLRHGDSQPGRAHSARSSARTARVLGGTRVGAAVAASTPWVARRRGRARSRRRQPDDRRGELAAGDPDAQRLVRRDVARVAHHVPVGPLHDRVAAVEGGGRRQRPDLRGEPGHLGAAVHERGVQRPSRTRRAGPSTRCSCMSTSVVGLASTGRLRQWSSPLCSAGEPVRQGGPGAQPRLGQPRALLADVGHDPLGRVGRRRGAEVRDQVEQRRVQVVPDRADQRRPAGRRHAHQGLVAERQQVLERPTAARDHDHVDARVPVQLRDRRADLGHRPRPLHGHAADLELHRRPPGARVGHHVVLGVALLRDDQPDHRRQERQRALARRLEQPLGAEHALEVLDPREQLAEPDQPHVVGGERQGPLLGVELRPGVHDEVRAVRQLVRQLVDGGGRGRDRQGHVEVGVAQREEVEGVPPLEVQHLTLDPHRRHLRDVVGDLGCQVPHRPGAVGGGVRRAQRGRAGRRRGAQGAGAHAPSLPHGADISARRRM